MDSLTTSRFNSAMACSVADIGVGVGGGPRDVAPVMVVVSPRDVGPTEEIGRKDEVVVVVGPTDVAPRAIAPPEETDRKDEVVVVVVVVVAAAEEVQEGGGCLGSD